MYEQVAAEDFKKMKSLIRWYFAKAFESGVPIPRHKIHKVPQSLRRSYLLINHPLGRTPVEFRGGSQKPYDKQSIKENTTMV